MRQYPGDVCAVGDEGEDAHRACALRTPAEELDIPPRTPLYWHAYRKKNFYYDGFVEKSHRDIMQFSFAPTLTGKTARAMEDLVASVPGPR